MNLRGQPGFSRLAAWCDRAVTGGLVFSVFFAPFAFGSVHPQAYGVLEVVAGLLVLVTLTRLWISGPPRSGVPIPPRRLWVPLVGFLAVVVLQLVPLPPGLLRVVSPSTYALYAQSLPGWPDKVPYEASVRALLARDDLGVQPEDTARPVRLPSPGEIERYDIRTIVPDAWGRLPGEPLLERSEREALERWVDPGRRGSFASWRTLSIDPGRTYAELLKILAYLLFFAVVTFYPLEPGSREDVRFQRRLLRAVALTAVAVAAVGLVQRFSWNGKILWFFVPWDWGAPRPLHPQTSGPFVSRNNFGGYLAMTLPLVLVPALARTRIDLRRSRLVTQVVFGVGAALCASALFFSLSRGAWGAVAVGLGVFLVLLVRRVPATNLSAVLRDRRRGLGVGAAVAAVLFLLVLLPTDGAEMGSDIDRRLEETVRSSASWKSRVESWRDSLPMIVDHPVMGVGLSSWGTAFPRYDESFFLGTQARRAHNDYLQIVAETGLVGSLFLLGACVIAARRFVRILRTRSDRAYALQLAIAAGLLALLVHEFVDFDLQMPGIAITAVCLVGIGLRGGWRTRPVASGGASSRIRRFMAVSGVAAFSFLSLVFVQAAPQAKIETPQGLVAALRSIEESPVDSPAHLGLGVGFAEVSLDLARPPLDVAVAVNPNSPGPRDARAVLAAQMGDREQARADLEESIFRAPSRAYHPLLSPEVVGWLSPENREAAERGFRRAMDGVGYQAAVSLADFYSIVADHGAAARAWQQAADLAHRTTHAAALLRRAAWESLLVQDFEGAEALLRESITLAPGDAHARSILISRVLGERGDLEAARREREAGFEAGADPYEMDLAFAEAARRSGDPAIEIENLKRATANRPRDVRGHYRLGLAHYRLGAYDLSSLALQRATRAAPDYAPAWYYLARAAERNYDFALATKAYAEARKLDPTNANFRQEQERFSQRLETS